MSVVKVEVILRVQVLSQKAFVWSYKRYQFGLNTSFCHCTHAWIIPSGLKKYSLKSVETTIEQHSFWPPFLGSHVAYVAPTMPLTAHTHYSCYVL